MNVAVVGSFRDNTLPGMLSDAKASFEEACAAIGTRLAELGHRLIVPHPEVPGTAGSHALKGFKSVSAVRGYHQIAEREGGTVLKEHMYAVELSDALIIIGGLNGTYAATLSALRQRKLIIPIPLFGGAVKDLCEIPEISRMASDEIRNIYVGPHDWVKQLVEAIERALEEFPRVLIIHGRGDTGKDLRERIRMESARAESDLYGIATPVIMNLSGLGAITVPEVFESLASNVSAVVTIVTADDTGGLVRSEKGDISARELRLSARARENVWVEVGWFWGRLGRGRVLLWLKDLPARAVPSDLSGASRIEAETLDGAWPHIEAFLRQLRTAPRGR